MSRLSPTILVLVMLTMAGCPADEADDDTSQDDDHTTLDDDDSAAGQPVEGCGFADQVAGRFEVTEWYPSSEEWFAVVSGLTRDGPDPQLYEVAAEEGACRALQLALGVCDPPCDAMEVCTASDQCEPYPSAIAGGALSVAGLSEPVEIVPEEWNPGYYYASLGDADLFDAGVEVTATLVGDVFPALDLPSRGVSPMDTTLAAQVLTLVDGVDTTLTWTPGNDPDACVRLQLMPQWYGHGEPMPALLWCETRDTGSLTIPAAVAGAYPLGATPEQPCTNSACPWSHLARYERVTVPTEYGDAELRVQSQVDFRYEHLAAVPRGSRRGPAAGSRR